MLQFIMNNLCKNAGIFTEIKKISNQGRNMHRKTGHGESKHMLTVI